MNIRLLCKLLGILTLLIGVFMLFSLPWAWSSIGVHTDQTFDSGFEHRGFWALFQSCIVCAVLGGLLLWIGRHAEGKLYRKEAMAVVGLSWILATFLGALPYTLSGTAHRTSIKLVGEGNAVLLANQNLRLYSQWKKVDPVTTQQYRLLELLENSGSAVGLTRAELVKQGKAVGIQDPVGVFEQLQSKDGFDEILIGPGEDDDLAAADRVSSYRIRWVTMSIWDALFESQSGFSTTGATVITHLEDPILVPHCILFWRSSTHFLGGLGIIVLFVVVLGHGAAGKTLMRTEMPGPSKEGSMARMQSSAWVFAAIYVGLNALLAVILFICGMSSFDAICHAFGTMATGGFSTYNGSLGHFDSPQIEYIVTLFMILAGTNFTLLYFALIRQPGKLLADTEWQTYLLIIVVVTSLVVVFGIWNRDTGFESTSGSIRYGLFQVVSIVTTTGYGTNDFDSWNSFGRCALLILMFIGGCAGSTGGGMKVIRHLLFFKIIWLAIERSYRPRVVRTLKVGDKPVEDQQLQQSILVYFGLILVLFVFSWLFIVSVEPRTTWGVVDDSQPPTKLVDSASAVAATLNNIGPGLGIVGSTKNYSDFSGVAKLLFVWLMMLGRLEIYAILVLFSRRFWKDS